MLSKAGGQTAANLIGGMPITSRKEDGGILEATLGIVKKKEDGTYFYTAGHAVGKKGSFVGDPFIGRVEANLLEEDVDLAIVKVLAGIKVQASTVWVGNGETQEVTFEDKERPEEGEVLWVQGGKSGRVECSVFIPDADITEESTGENVSHVVIMKLDKDAQPGDSGAPVIGEGSNICYGIYGGKVKIKGEIYGWFTPFANISF